MIVNLDLAAYGLVSLDLARPEYLITGGLYLVLSALPLAALELTISKHRSGTANASRLKKFLHGLVSFVMLAVFPMTLLGVLGHRTMSEPGIWASLGTLFVGAGVLWFNGLTLSAMWREVRGRQQQDESLVDFVIRAIPRAGVGTFFPLLMALGLYVVFVFPSLPRQVGGGSKPVVKLVLSEWPTIEWDELRIANSATARTVGPVGLLLETSGQYVVVPIDDRRTMLNTRGAIGVDKRMISAIVYTKANTIPIGVLLRPSGAKTN